MSLRDYVAIPRDKFELQELVTDGFDFPCGLCKHRHGTDRDEPCRTCDHNINSIIE